MKLPQELQGPVAAIGDVHGQLDKLSTVLGKLRESDPEGKRWILFIGDLVDRGPDSKGVLDAVVDLIERRGRTAVIAGNHDFVMAAALELVETPSFSNWADRWLGSYESESTFRSYGVEFGDLAALKEALPPTHRQLLANLPWCVFHPDYLFIHAGLDPAMDVETQLRILKARDFTLNRPDWLCSRKLAQCSAPAACTKTIVSGHVQYDRVQFDPKRIRIDTTGGREGDLSCVLLPEKKVLTSGSAPEKPPPRRSWWNKLTSK